MCTSRPGVGGQLLDGYLKRKGQWQELVNLLLCYATVEHSQHSLNSIIVEHSQQKYGLRKSGYLLQHLGSGFNIFKTGNLSQFHQRV